MGLQVYPEERRQAPKVIMNTMNFCSFLRLMQLFLFLFLLIVNKQGPNKKSK